jgi:hypothetical protein
MVPDRGDLNRPGHRRAARSPFGWKHFFRHSREGGNPPAMDPRFRGDDDEEKRDFT